jgi:hypothetical protein
MKFYLSTFSRVIMTLLFFILLSAFSHFGYAQKILSEMETHYVLEAQQQLNAALSDPAMDQAERLRIVERSARTLKEYGQPPAFPKGSIPLKELMQSNFDLARDQYNDVNDLRRVVNNMNHEARMKFINHLQIEVVEEQVKFLLPGYTPFTLAQSLVNTNLDINIADGVNRGDVDDARTLVRLFKEIAEANKLAGMLDKLFNDHRFTSENLHRDLRMVEPLEAQLRKRYELAAAGTHIIRGYEGARLAGNFENSVAIKSENSQQKQVVTVDDDFRETKFYYRLSKVEPVKKINSPNIIQSISVSENSTSISVMPPKPKESYTATATWNSPPSAIYSGDVINITAKGSGDARIAIEVSNSRTQFARSLRNSEGNKNSTETLTWKANPGSEAVYITVRTLPGANAWAFTSVTFHYESVRID